MRVFTAILVGGPADGGAMTLTEGGNWIHVTDRVEDKILVYIYERRQNSNVFDYRETTIDYEGNYDEFCSKSRHER
jgi:hypothetical protein